MGNRAVIQMKGSNVGIYLHVNGGRDSVEGFLTYCKLRGFRGDDYGMARLTQVIANFFGGDLSIGIDTIDRLDCDNWDNGMYIIDENFDIIERKYMHNEEQHKHNLFTMVYEINECQPQRDQLNLNDDKEIRSKLNEIYCQLNGIE